MPSPSSKLIVDLTPAEFDIIHEALEAHQLKVGSRVRVLERLRTRFKTKENEVEGDVFVALSPSALFVLEEGMVAAMETRGINASKIPTARRTLALIREVRARLGEGKRD